MILELKPNYDSRKSFYGKAVIEFNERNNINKTYTLYSYGKPVMTITKKYIYFEKNPELYTYTTMRHIRELLRQYGGQYETYRQYKNSLYNMTKKHILKGYIFHNALRTYADTRQTAIKGFNNEK